MKYPLERTRLQKLAFIEDNKFKQLLKSREAAAPYKKLCEQNFSYLIESQKVKFLSEEEKLNDFRKFLLKKFCFRIFMLEREQASSFALG